MHGYAGVDAEGLPGEDTFGGELGEDFGVASGYESFLGDFAGDLVLAVAVGDAADPSACQDEGTVEADGADDVVEDALVGPLGECLFLGLGEAEVDFGAEELVDAGVAVAGEQLLGAEEAESVFEVAGDGVLSAFASSEGEVGDAGSEAAGVESHHAAVFIVGMGDDVHDGGAGVELAEELLEAKGAFVDGEFAARERRRAFATEVGGVVEGDGRLGFEMREGGCGEERKGEGRGWLHVF